MPRCSALHASAGTSSVREKGTLYLTKRRLARVDASEEHERLLEAQPRPPGGRLARHAVAERARRKERAVGGREVVEALDGAREAGGAGFEVAAAHGEGTEDVLGDRGGG